MFGWLLQMQNDSQESEENCCWLDDLLRLELYQPSSKRHINQVSTMSREYDVDTRKSFTSSEKLQGHGGNVKELSNARNPSLQVRIEEEQTAYPSEERMNPNKKCIRMNAFNKQKDERIELLEMRVKKLKRVERKPGIMKRQQKFKDEIEELKEELRKSTEKQDEENPERTDVQPVTTKFPKVSDSL